MDRRIKIRHLQALLEIVRQGSLKGAAERLYVTQPAISRTLAELEDITGATLLQRSRGGISLTPQGEYFHGFALTSVSALEEGLQGLDPQSRGALQHLRVGALPSVASRLMPEAIRRLKAGSRGIRITIADGSHEHLVAMLQANDLDLVIGRLGAPETMRGLSFAQLYLEEVAIVARPEHPMLRDPDLAQLENWPVILPAPWAAIRPLVDKFMIAHGLSVPSDCIETVSVAFGRAYVPESDAIWFISAGVVADDLAHGRLMRLPIGTALTAGPVGAMVRTDAPESAERRSLMQAVEQSVQALGLG